VFSSEVRLAGQSFLKMRGRIKRHIEQRTTMLAGVSHDLRTPLTRLKLHLAMQKSSEDNEAAKQDLKDMELMLDGYLDFARGLADEASQQVNVKSYLSDIILKQDNECIEGVGLGLSIARDITQIHGGTLRLDESDMGGLKAIIRLPR